MTFCKELVRENSCSTCGDEVFMKKKVRIEEKTGKIVSYGKIVAELL